MAGNIAVFAGELIQQVSLHEAFPFILPKPPTLLLPQTMLWTGTAGASSASRGVLPPFTSSTS